MNIDDDGSYEPDDLMCAGGREGPSPCYKDKNGAKLNHLPPISAIIVSALRSIYHCAPTSRIVWSHFGLGKNQISPQSKHCRNKLFHSRLTNNKAANQ